MPTHTAAPLTSPLSRRVVPCTAARAATHTVNAQRSHRRRRDRCQRRGRRCRCRCRCCRLPARRAIGATCAAATSSRRHSLTSPPLAWAAAAGAATAKRRPAASLPLRRLGDQWSLPSSCRRCHRSPACRTIGAARAAATSSRRHLIASPPLGPCRSGSGGRPCRCRLAAPDRCSLLPRAAAAAPRRRAAPSAPLVPPPFDCVAT